MRYPKCPPLATCRTVRYRRAPDNLLGTMQYDDRVNDVASTVRAWANAMPRGQFLARVKGLYLIITLPATNGDQLAFDTRSASRDRLMRAAAAARSRAVFAVEKSERSPYSTHISLGRARNCDVVLRDSTVSKLHAQLYESNGRWHVVDRGSANGTSLNGTPLGRDQPLPIAAGDRIKFGTLQCLVADARILLHEFGPENDGS
jgi:hypothetical protein